ncbi:hypothetical protein AB0J28_31745 [Streptosporangium canum]|uniref:hypothetical protein n=1 Tax=Streptosporangium canum TaxID=324952 RepID=UPI003430F670
MSSGGRAAEGDPEARELEHHDQADSAIPLPPGFGQLQEAMELAHRGMTLMEELSSLEPEVRRQWSSSPRADGPDAEPAPWADLEAAVHELVRLVEASPYRLAPGYRTSAGSVQDLIDRTKRVRSRWVVRLNGRDTPVETELRLLLRPSRSADPDQVAPREFSDDETQDQAGTSAPAHTHDPGAWQTAQRHRTVRPRPAGELAVVYLDDESQYRQVRTALAEALDAFGLQVDSASLIIRGSIWQAFLTALKRQTAEDRLEQGGDAFTAGAKARWYGEPQSQITKAQGEAIAALLTTLENTQNALLAFSNILIVKIDGVPLVRELTPEQVDHLQKNPRLYTDPRLALGVLDVGLAAVHESGLDER